ncbi:trypsin-like peptidase domain-containing protein [Rhizobium ruizarguesonis]
MRYLDQDTIHELHQTAVELNLHDRRDQLLAGLSNQYISQILNSNNASGQLLNDLNQMNSTPYITDNVVPLYRWLRNAAYAVSYRADMQSYFRNYAERVMDQYLSDYSPQKSANAKARPERILFVNDLLPFGFLRGAERAGAATARLTVPAFSGRQPINFPSTTTQKNYYATGWLIGPRHLITNHHVINARGVDEPDASLDDFSFQAQRTVAEFDYDQRGVPGHAVKVEGVVAASKELDYAILAVDTLENRRPLTLCLATIEIGDGSYMPVNIVQHPNGTTKQMAIRNNLAAKLTDRDLAYFTSTDGGSSGSAVCNDEWQVVALHKESNPTMGRFEFQGKSTVWVNVGTRIDRVIEHLRINHPAVWDKINADVKH